jgi:hypothetical protein
MLRAPEVPIHSCLRCPWPPQIKSLPSPMPHHHFSPGSRLLLPDYVEVCLYQNPFSTHTESSTCANFAAIELFGWLPHLRQVTCGCMRFGFSPQKSYQLEIITFLQWSDPTIKLYYIYKKSYQFDMISCYWSSHLHDYYLCNSGMSTRNGTCWAHTRAQKTIDSDDPQLFYIFYVYTNSQAVAGWLTSSLVASRFGQQPGFKREILF